VFWKKLALFAAMTALCLVVAEFGVRAVGLGINDYMYEVRKLSRLMELAPGGYLVPPPHASFRMRGHEIRTNSLGMRDVEPPAPGDPGGRRLLFLGDSVTFGQGVAYEDSFPVRLRKALAGTRTRVNVAAVPGWNSESELAFLEAQAERLAPDHVVLLYVVNDREPIAELRRERAAASGLRERLYRTAVLRSRLVEWAAFVYRSRFPHIDNTGLQAVVQVKEEVASYGEPFAPADPGWLRSRRAIEQMREVLAARDAGLTLCFHRHVSDPIGEAAFTRLRELAAETGIPVVDTLAWYAGHTPKELRLAAFDPHPNELGHRLLAEGMQRALERLQVVPAGKAEPREAAPSQDGRLPVQERATSEGESR
jgi:lysophospholipase L1-like esterase